MPKKYRRARVPGHIRGPLNTAKRRGWVKTLTKMQKGCCYWCSRDLGDDATFEHLIPLSRGGEDSIRNGAAAHRKCNQAKGNMLPDEYRAHLAARAAEAA